MADEIALAAGLEQMIEGHAEVRTAAQTIAENIAEAARNAAPVGDPSIDDASGSYKQSIVVQQSNKGNSGLFRVFAGDRKASWIEFGNANQPARFILRNAAESLGYQFIKKG